VRQDDEVTGGRRSWWFWPTIVVVVAAVITLIAWTLAQTSALGDDASIGPGSTDTITAIAWMAID
jgi:hypothetical protein